MRQDSRFRSRVRQGGDYPPEPGRYHLYVSWACPWASRTMIYRALKDLEDRISVTVVDPLMLSHGWVIASGADPINRADPATTIHVIPPIPRERHRLPRLPMTQSERDTE